MAMYMTDMDAMIVYVYQKVSFFMLENERYEERMLLNKLIVITKVIIYNKEVFNIFGNLKGSKYLFNCVYRIKI